MTSRAKAVEGSSVGLVRHLLHASHLFIMNLRRSQLTQMAAALSYRTIFGLLPTLAIGLVALAAFSSENTQRSVVRQFLTYAGLSEIKVKAEDQAAVQGAPVPSEASLEAWINVLAERAVSNIKKLPFDLIGIIALGTLIYAAVSMLVEIEQAFNQIYKAPEGKSWVRRVIQYWTLLTLGPLLLIASFGVSHAIEGAARRSTESVLAPASRPGAPADPAAKGTPPGPQTPAGTGAATTGTAITGADATGPAVTGAAVTGANAPAGPRTPASLTEVILKLVGHITSAFVSTLALTIIYVTVPNTRVMLTPALLGAAAASVGWEVGKYGFTEYLSYSTGYTKLYGAIAILPLFLLWVYVTWVIVLTGLQMAHTMQTYRMATAKGLTESVLISLGLKADPHRPNKPRIVDQGAVVAVLIAVAERFGQGRPSDHGVIADRTGLDADTASELLEKLTGAGALLRVEGSERDMQGYTLSRPAEAISGEALAEFADSVVAGRSEGAVRRVADLFAGARRQALAGKSLADLVGAVGAVPQGGPGPGASSPGASPTPTLTA